MVRNTIRLAALAAASLLALTACTGGEESAGGGTAGGPTTIDFWSWSDLTDPVGLWNREHPELQVNYQRISSSADVFQKLQAAVTAGSGAPDIVQVDYNNLTSLVVSGLLQPITGKTGAVQSDFAPSVWSQVTLAGNVYGVPQDVGPQVLFYRKDLFDQHGVGVPTTWDEYRAAAEKLKQADPNIFMTAFPSNGGVWFASLAWNGGGRWFATEGDAWKVSIDDQATRKVAQYWQGLFDAGLVKGDTHWQPTWYSGLTNGTYATWIGPSWGAAALRTNTPTLSGKWAIAPLPQWDAAKPNTVFWGGSLTAVTSTSKKVDAGLTFIDWLNTSQQAAPVLAEDVFPAATEGQKAPGLHQPDPFFGNQVLADRFTTTDASSSEWTWGPTMTDTTNQLNDGIQKFLNRATTLADMLTAVQASTVKTLSDKGLSVK